jgi:hypothetical protein
MSTMGETSNWEQTEVFVDTCGCQRTVVTDEDPNYDGYETDRVEVTRKLCEVHQKEIDVLREKDKEFRKVLEAANKNNEAIRIFYRSFDDRTKIRQVMSASAEQSGNTDLDNSTTAKR